MKLLAKILAVVLLAGSAVVVARHLEAPPPTAFVTKVPVTRGDVVQVVSATGTLAPVRTVSVGSQVSGTVTHLHVDYNSLVRQGQLLAEIDAAPARQQLAVAQASLDQAKSSLAQDQARADNDQLALERMQALVHDEQETAEDLDAAQLTVEADKAKLRQDQASINAAIVSVSVAQLNIDHCTILSPIDGVVVARDVDEGQTLVSAVVSPTIYELASDLKTLQLIGTTDEADVPGLREGQDARFTVDAWPGATFHGVVRQVRLNATTVNNVVTYQTVIDVNNPDLRLRPGMTTHFMVDVGRSADVLRVPASALRFTPLANARIPFPATDVPASVPAAPTIAPGRPGTVWKVDGSRLVPVKVTMGRTDGTLVEVSAAGLVEGDLIVTGIVTGKK